MVAINIKQTAESRGCKHTQKKPAFYVVGLEANMFEDAHCSCCLFRCIQNAGANNSMDGHFKRNSKLCSLISNDGC